MSLGLVGSALPASQHLIEGLTLATTTAKTIAVRATRDGKVIGEKSFAVPYVTSPGPNGPGCEPNQARSQRSSPSRSSNRTIAIE